MRHWLWRRARVAELRRRARPLSRGEFAELLALSSPHAFYAPFVYRRQRRH